MTIAAPVPWPSAGRNGVSVGMSFGSVPMAPGALSGQRGIGSAASSVELPRRPMTAARARSVRIGVECVGKLILLIFIFIIIPTSHLSFLKRGVERDVGWG